MTLVQNMIIINFFCSFDHPSFSTMFERNMTLPKTQSSLANYARQIEFQCFSDAKSKVNLFFLIFLYGTILITSSFWFSRSNIFTWLPIKCSNLKVQAKMRLRKKVKVKSYVAFAQKLQNVCTSSWIAGTCHFVKSAAIQLWRPNKGSVPFVVKKWRRPWKHFSNRAYNFKTIYDVIMLNIYCLFRGRKNEYIFPKSEMKECNFCTPK